MAIKQAMILAAGLGSRLKPWTDFHPKALAIVNGQSLLQRNIQYLQTYKIFDVVVNVHHFADQIEDAIRQKNGWGSNVVISDERLEVLETGGGILKAKSLLQHADNFVLMNADMLTNLNLQGMIDQHLASTNCLATLAVTKRDSSRQLLFSNEHVLGGWQNNVSKEEKIIKQDCTLHPFAFSGIHVIEKRLLNLIEQQGKFSMIDVYLSLCAKQNIVAYNHTGDLLLDVGKPESLAIAEKLFV